MGRQVVLISSPLIPASIMATIWLCLLFFNHISNANMILELKNKFENLSPEEMMIARWKHEQRKDDRRLLSAIDVNMGAELYPGLAIFFAKMVLGNPAKTFYPLIDPTISLTWLYCNGCQLCPTKSSLKFKLNHYEVSNSIKGKNVACDDKMCSMIDKNSMEQECSDNICKYSMEYVFGGAMTAGNVVSDTLLINTVTGNNQTSPVFTDFVFGCGFDQYNGLENSDWAFDGSLGVGMSNLSMLSQLIASKHVKKNTWSHCFKRESKGGTMAFGEVEMQKEMKMTPLVPDSEMYKVTVVNFSIGGKPIAVDDEQETLIDISSAYNYFPDAIYTAILTEIQNAFQNLKFTQPDPFSCFLYNNGRIDDDFPVITYTFKGGVELKLSPNQYIFERSADEWCLAIINSNKKTLKNYFIITESALMGRLVVYNVGKKKIGWTDYDCDQGIKIIDDETRDVWSVNSHYMDHLNFSASVKVGVGAMVMLLNVIFSYLTLSN